MAKRAHRIFVFLDHRARHTKTDGVGLTGHPASVDPGNNVDATIRVNDLQRLRRALAMRQPGKVVIQFPAVDEPPSSPRPQNDACDAGLASSYGLDLLYVCH